jgi:hypothetical protein
MNGNSKHFAPVVHRCKHLSGHVAVTIDQEGESGNVTLCFLGLPPVGKLYLALNACVLACPLCSDRLTELVPAKCSLGN